MTYDVVRSVRFILNHFNFMTSPDFVISIEIDDFQCPAEIKSLAYGCVKELREMIIACYRRTIEEPVMVCSDEIYEQVTSDRWGNLYDNRLGDTPFNVIFKDITLKNIEVRRKRVIEPCYKTIEDKLHNTRRLGEDKFKGLKELHFHKLFDFELDHLWRHYQQRWEETHPKPKPELRSPFPKPREEVVETVKPRQPKKSFYDRLVKYVREHIGDKLMTKDEFEQLVRSWPKTRKTLDEWYDTYVDLYIKQPGNVIKIDDVEIHGSGYKSRSRGSLPYCNSAAFSRS